MTTTYFHAFGFAWHQRQADAEVLGIAKQAIRIVQTEGNADNRRAGRQRDVALIEIQADSEDFLAFVFILADEAQIRDGSSIGSCGRSGQAKTGNVLAAGQAGQKVIFLIIGSVM